MYIIYLYTADRAKSIKTRATVNESPTDKLIRELREENAKLLEMIKKGNYQLTDAPSGASDEGKSDKIAHLEEKSLGKSSAWAQRVGQGSTHKSVLKINPSSWEA